MNEEEKRAILDACEENYPDILRHLPKEFTSPTFIRMLSQHHQHLYIELLFAYREVETPFQVVHALLAQRLRNHAQRTNEETQDRNVFGVRRPFFKWRKKEPRRSD